MPSAAAAPTSQPAVRIRPWLSLALLSLGHAVNHAQAALLPLVYLAIIVEFGVGVAAVAFLAAIGNVAAGTLQISYGWLTRIFTRRSILGVGGLVFGGGMAAQALAPGFTTFAAANVVSRIGGSPQHPVGNGLLAEQFPPHRRGFAIAAHIAGGNVGTVAVPLLGLALIEAIGWRWTVVLFGLPAVAVGLAIWAMVRETGADRAAARAYGSVRSAYWAVLRDRDLLLVYASAVLGGGGRGLGVLNVFVPIYLSIGLGLDTATVGLMYAVLVVGSVPGPIVAGWLSDRFGRRLMIVVTYLAGAASIALFVLAGADQGMLWLAIVLLSIFNFVESPQLQALLADIAPRNLRDAAFAAYFTLAFGIGSLWVLLYGVVIDVLGESAGLPVTFWLMSISFVAAALVVLPIRVQQRLAAAGEADRVSHAG